jgi:hypothetical protein
MFRLLKLIVFLAAAAWAFQHYHPDGRRDGATSSGQIAGTREPYAGANRQIIVYGIECIQTRTYRKMLEKNRIPYQYRDINAAFRGREFASDIQPRLNASGISPQGISGALVDINGRFYIMPGAETIRAAAGIR